MKASFDFYRVGLVFLVLMHFGPLSPMGYFDTHLWQQRYALIGPEHPEWSTSGVALVHVGDETLAQVPSAFPWNRRIVVELFEKLHALGARRVVCGLELLLHKESLEDPEQDQVLEAYLKSHPEFLYLGAGPGTSLEMIRDPAHARFQEAGLREFGPGYVFDEDRHLLSLSLGEDESVEMPAGLRALLADLEVPAPAGRDQVRINEWFRDKLPVLEAGDVLAEKFSSPLLEGTTVFLGGSSLVLHDTYDTSAGIAIPGISMFSAGFLTAREEAEFRSLPALVWILLLGACAGSLAWFARRRFGYPTALFGFILSGAWWQGSMLLGSLTGWILPAAAPASFLFFLTVLEILRQRSRPDTEHELFDPLVEREARQAFDLGTASLAEGRTRDAIRNFQVVTELESKRRHRALHRLAIAYLQEDRIPAAIQQVDRMDPTRVMVRELYLLASELEAIGEKKRAKRLYDEIFVRDREFLDVRKRIDDLRHELASFTEDEVVETIARRVIDRRYQDVQLFRKGGGGFLFRASDSQDQNRDVVLKILSPLQMNHVEVYRRFLAEARNVSALNHPNIVEVFDVYESNVPYFTMEYLNGLSLIEVFDREGTVSWSQLRPWVDQILQGLSFAHAAGIVHRDIKPHNFMVLEDGRVKVIDFGIARFHEEEELTGVGQLMGTPMYMSPEQVRGDELDARSDLFSLAIVLYEGLVGELPFAGMGSRLVERAAPIPASAGVPKAASAWLERMLEPLPEDRFLDAEEARGALP